MASDKHAEFQFYINRQGPRGRQGDKGDKGFSPSISINTNTDKEFTLDIHNEFDTFTTPNLKEGLIPEDRGGTYVRKDTETGMEYFGEADRASIDSFGEVRFASDEEVATRTEGLVVDASNVQDIVQENLISIQETVQEQGIRLLTAENAVERADQDITVLQNSLGNTQTKVTTNTSDISILNSKVNSITGNVTDLDTSVFALESDLNSVRNDVQTNQSEINENIVNIDALETRVDGMQNVINQHSTDVENLNTNKQDKLIAGDNITIIGNTISATGGGGGGSFDPSQNMDLTGTVGVIGNKFQIKSSDGLNYGTVSFKTDPISQADGNGSFSDYFYPSKALVGNLWSETFDFSTNTYKAARVYNQANLGAGNSTELKDEMINMWGDGELSPSGKKLIEVKPATSTTLGGVKIGDGISVTSDGTISVNGGGGSGGGDVTASGDNDFTGSNTFDIFGGHFLMKNLGSTMIDFVSEAGSYPSKRTAIKCGASSADTTTFTTYTGGTLNLGSASSWNSTADPANFSGIQIRNDDCTFIKSDGTIVDMLAAGNAANKDLSNVSTIATTKMAHSAMPSMRYIELTLGASGSTYVAPADGYVTIEGGHDNTAGFPSISLGGEGFWISNTISATGSSGGSKIRVFKPVHKNGSFIVNYNRITSSTLKCRFFYTEGAPSA